MRLLFLSNYFPPATVGGYEQWCQEVAQALVKRGHQVSIITSRAEVEDNGGIPVHRVIELEVVGGLGSTISRFLRRHQLEAASLATIKQLVNTIQPEAALIWGMWNVPKSVPALIEHLLGERTAYYFCDYWPTLPSAFVQQLSAPARRTLASLPKKLIAAVLQPRLRQSPSLAFPNPICVSQAVRRLLAEAGIKFSHARIIHGGTDLLPAKSTVHTGATVRLLYLGRLTRDKGLHTVIEAMRILSERAMAVELDVYGQGDSDYIKSLCKAIVKCKLTSAVELRGTVTRAELPGLFPHYDALVFPSHWQEPFARTVLEAMAAGLVVIGTTTGGTGEILKNRETGLTFKAGNAFELADQIECVARDCTPFRTYSENARNAVLQHFTLTKMVDQIEEALFTISGSTLTSAKVVNI